jgi:sphingolipid delta-4 desaturase
LQGKNSEAFYWSESKEPHFERRKQILAAHPEVKDLFGVDPYLWLKSILAVIGHFGIAIWFLPDHLGWMFLLSLVAGATFSHVIFLAIHEITHDLAFKNKVANNWLAIIVNAPILFPFAMAFKYYHADHHWQQGKEGVDTDLPTEQEALLFRGFFGKLIWMINQILFYAIRPMTVKRLPVNRWVIVNLIFQLVVSVLMIYFAGWQTVLYLLLSLFLSGGLHPIAGHFIAEHYVFKEGQETYSYYGPLNSITFNVGYHNEHHDFPNIPGSRLPKLRAIASEYYDSLYSYNSWTQVLYRFLVDEGLSLFSRVKRR